MWSQITVAQFRRAHCTKGREKPVMMGTISGVKVFHFNLMIICFVIVGKLISVPWLSILSRGKKYS